MRSVRSFVRVICMAETPTRRCVGWLGPASGWTRQIEVRTRSADARTSSHGVKIHALTHLIIISDTRFFRVYVLLA